MSLVKRHKPGNGIESTLIRQPPTTHEQGRILYSPAIVLEGHTNGPVFSTKFNQDGTKLVLGGMDKQILLWTLPTHDSPHAHQPNHATLHGHRGAVTSAKWTRDDTMIVSASADCTVGIWDSHTGARIRKCQGHSGVVNDVAVVAVVGSEEMIVSVGDDGCGLVWDSRHRGPVAEVGGDGGVGMPMLSAASSHLGRCVYMTGIDPRILAYDVRMMDRPLWETKSRSGLGISSINVSPDDTMLVSRSLDGVVRTYNAKEFVPEGVERLIGGLYEGAPSGKENLLIRACFSNDNIKIVSGSEDASVCVWDLATRRIVGKYGGHEGTVIDVDYHPLENIIVSSSTDGTIIVREV